MSLDNFILGKILGKGSYGSVRIVERKEDHKIYAMKSVVINILNEKEKLNSFNEVRLLASLKHQNIIDYKESFFDNNANTLNIVMEYADDGDLRSKISKISKEHLSFEETTIWNVLIQTLEGLKYLHKNNIIHRDLKSANIFLTKSGLIKIGDLNVSTILKKGVANTQTGTPYYASPEIWNDKPYNSKCDIWSLGCIIYEMATLHVPFRGTSLHQLFCKIMKGKYLQIPNRYSKDLKNIIKIILVGDPEKRPSAEELLKNEIVIKKARELGINNNMDNILSEKVILIKTIKIPKNISQINKQLPQKRYELIKIKNKEEMFNNDEYEYSKNNFYKLSNQEQNNIIKESLRKNNELNNEKEKENNIGNINVNEVIITTNDTDRIYNSENNKNEKNKEENITNNNTNNNNNNEELDNLIIKSEPMNENEINIIKDNIKKKLENINIYKQRLKKPYKDTGYHFFSKNKEEEKKCRNDSNGGNINNIKSPNKKSEINDKKRRNTQPEKKQKESNIQKLPKIRPKSVKNLIQRNKIKENNSKKNIIINNNNNNKEMRQYSCISANKKNKKNEYNSYIEKEKEKDIENKKNKLEKIKKNKNFEKENDKNVNNQNLFRVNHKKKMMRPISSRHYDKNKINVNHEPKSPNINNNKNMINKRKFQIYYNQYFNEKNENKNNKHKIIYEKIEIERNGKKNKYKRGNAQVKYIDIGNHYNQYKKLMNNNKYIIFEFGKKVGPRMILPNKW